MKRTIAALISLVILCAMVVSTSAEETETRSIEIVKFDYDVLTSGTVEEMEAEAYPSRMELPTKWIDISAFIPFSGTFDVSKELYSFLMGSWPEAGGQFTYPEYFAARMYLGWVRIRQSSTQVQLKEPLSNLGNTVSGWELWEPRSTTQIADPTYLHKLFQLYRDTLVNLPDYWTTDSSKEYSELKDCNAYPYILTLGFEFPWFELYSLDFEDQIESGIEFLDKLPAWIETAGLKETRATTELHWTYNPQDGAADENSIQTAEESEVSGETSEPQSNLERASESFEKLPNGKQGFQDIFISTCSFLVIPMVLAMLAVTFMRKRR